MSVQHEAEGEVSDQGKWYAVFAEEESTRFVLSARLGDASSDLAGDTPDLVAASAVCPVGLPLDEVAAVVRRLSIR